MKLRELISMIQEATTLQDAIASEFNLKAGDPMIKELVKYLMSNHDSEAIDDFLYDHFEADMPYNVKTDDPRDWIANHMVKIFKGQY